MTKLKLVVNNSFSDFKKNEIFFNRQELKIILNLYAKMVSQGYWKDYSFNISKKRNIYEQQKIRQFCEDILIHNKKKKQLKNKQLGVEIYSQKWALHHLVK